MVTVSSPECTEPALSGSSSGDTIEHEGPGPKSTGKFKATVEDIDDDDMQSLARSQDGVEELTDDFEAMGMHSAVKPPIRQMPLIILGVLPAPVYICDGMPAVLLTYIGGFRHSKKVYVVTVDENTGMFDNWL
ncbi:hypothetical protein NM688_g1005 [Phlebia brevispora]|uniref:Uncharacterized protein n=1 Tax=Phlebia brevispora TaxID=194682 RepID=A0ACC1TCU2_9APHY|nr:hypothetical protein NM688_g1005 [Phlebia brevispora]